MIAVIRGVLYDAKHFDGELGYERPLEHLRDYAKDLGMSSSESESESEGEGSSMLLISGSSDSDDGDDQDGESAGADDERTQSPLAAFNADGAASPVVEVGPKGLDNISKAFDREVASLASILTNVQGSVRAQADPDKTLRKSLMIVLRSEYEFEQLKLRGLRPVAMGSVGVHGTEDRTCVRCCLLYIHAGD